MTCLFCDIIHKKIPAKIIYEDDASVALLDLHPCAKGHTLVIPKRHVETILELSKEESGPFWQGVKHVTKLLEERLAPHGFTIGINHGKVSGQAIEHLHVHIMPRYQGDGGGSLHSVINNPQDASLEEVYNQITNP